MTTIFQSTVSEFLLCSDRAQTGVVKRFSSRGDYNPGTDFYKSLRDAIRRSLKSGLQVDEVEFMKTIKEKNRRNNYPQLVNNYNQIFSSQNLLPTSMKGSWFHSGEVDVSMNPVWERKDGDILILTFVSWKKDQKWTEDLASILLQIPAIAFKEQVPDDTVFELLDLQTLKSFSIASIDVDRVLELQDELEAFWEIFINL